MNGRRSRFGSATTVVALVGFVTADGRRSRMVRDGERLPVDDAIVQRFPDRFAAVAEEGGAYVVAVRGFIAPPKRIIRRGDFLSAADPLAKSHAADFVPAGTPPDQWPPERTLPTIRVMR